MSDIQIQIDRARSEKLAKVLGDFAQYVKDATTDVVKEEGALTCREAINFSPPLDGGDGSKHSGGGKGDKKIAERWGNMAIVYDVLTVVQEDSKQLGVAVNAKTGSRDKFMKWKMGKPPKSYGLLSKIYNDNNVERAYERAKKIMMKWKGSRSYQQLGVSGIKSWHDKVRGMYKGRIRKNGGVDAKGIAKPLNGYYKFASSGDIKSYIKERQKRVGWMKAGWVDAINKIGKPKINGIEKSYGLRKLPAWITRHTATHGKTGLNYNNWHGTHVVMTVQNNLGNIFGLGYLAGTKNFVIQVRAGKMTKRMRHLMNAAIEKANKGNTPT